MSYILPAQTNLKIYNSLFRSHLEYGIIAWGCFSEVKINQLVSIQKKVIRNIAGVKYNTHTDPLFTKFKILKAPDHLQLNMNVFMYNYDGGKVPPSFNNFFTRLNSYDRSKNFCLDIARNKKLHKFSSYYLPKLWNALSLEIKRSTSLNVFKNKCKDLFFSSYNYPCKLHDSAMYVAIKL